MRYSLPFLYLPDAISLILLLIAFTMLRRITIDHIRQELLIIREGMLCYWMNNALDPHDRGYEALGNLIEISLALVPRLSPGRLVFIRRLQRKTAKHTAMLPWPDPFGETRRLIECTANAKGRELLKRLQMEMNLGLGFFFLMGSLSGWFLMFIIIPRMLKKTFLHHKHHPADFFFDMFERVLGSIGRQALQIGCAGQNLAITTRASAAF
jgi:hypothetical protein